MPKIFLHTAQHYLLKKHSYTLISRSYPLISFIRNHCFKEVIEISSYDEIPDGIKNDKVLVFFHVLPFNIEESLLAIRYIENNHPNWKIVILDIADGGMVNEWKDAEINHPYVEVVGSRITTLNTVRFGGQVSVFPKTSNRLSGFGFLYKIKVEPRVLWEDRKDDLYFRGSLVTKSRADFLRRIKETGFKTDINAFVPTQHSVDVDFIRDCHFSEIAGSFDCLWSPPAGYLKHKDYCENLSHYKYCLAPNGYTHSHRILEGMAMGCLVITNSLSNINFSVNPFKDGVTHLEVGDECEKIDEVINQCMTSDLRQIAENGRNVYLKYFKLDKHGCLPYETMAPLIRKIEDAIEMPLLYSKLLL